MSVFRELGPVPEGYFPHLRDQMINAGLVEVNFYLDLITGERRNFDVHTPFGEQFTDFNLPEPNEGLGATMGETLVMEGWQPKVDRIADTAVDLNDLIMESSVRAREYSEAYVALRAYDLKPSLRRGHVFHSDGSRGDDFVGVFACDNEGTLHPSPVLRRPRRMPINTMIEFEPTTEHEEPLSNSKDPIPRTFIRFTYVRDIITRYSDWHERHSRAI